MAFAAMPAAQVPPAVAEVLRDPALTAQNGKTSK